MMLPRTILVEITLVKIAKGLTRLRVELTVQRISLTIGRSKVCTTDRSNAIVRTSDYLTTDLRILRIDMDQTRGSVEEQTVIIQLVCRCRSYGMGVTLIPPEDDSLIGASTTMSDGELS